MITILTEKYNSISQEKYDEIIEKLEFQHLCCSCGHRGCLERHASYTRSIRIHGEKVALRIQRVKCKECGKTHALLLSIMVPYSQIPLSDQQEIAIGYENGTGSDDVLDRNCLIDEREVSYIICRYRRHWLERLRAAKIDVFSEDILTACHKVYCRGFMQIKKTANILFPLPT